MVTRARDRGPLAREIEHTADLGFEVEAPSPALLFERAGLAMAALMVELDTVEPRERVALAVEAEGREELLHDWLQALLVRFGRDGFVPCELDVDVADARRAAGTAAGERFDRRRHRLLTELKAVTWHGLAVREHDRGWWARVIFDV
jgi:SHS2 domain-containing protein